MHLLFFNRLHFGKSISLLIIYILNPINILIIKILRTITKIIIY